MPITQIERINSIDDDLGNMLTTVAENRAPPINPMAIKIMSNLFRDMPELYRRTPVLAVDTGIFVAEIQIGAVGQTGFGNLNAIGLISRFGSHHVRTFQLQRFQVVG